MPPVLITGFSGFVGSNLVEALQVSHTIYGLDLEGKGRHLLAPGQRFTWNQLKNAGENETHSKADCPFCRPGGVSEVEAIIHLAGKAHDTANVSDEASYFDVNLGLTRRIFDHFLQSNASTFIFFSSVKAVADSVENGVLTEEALPCPATPYGRSKLAAEQYIMEQWMAWEKAKQPLSGHKTGSPVKRVFILRPCMIHGPGNKGNLSLLYNIVRKGFPWPLGAFHNQRSFASINNVAFVVQRLLKDEVGSGIYHMADDEPVSTNHLVALISEGLNRKPRIWNLPKALVKTTARAGEVLRLPLNSERLQKLTESYVVSNQKLKLALGIQNMPEDATSGLRKTLESFRLKTGK